MSPYNAFRYLFGTRFDAYQCLKFIIGVNFVLGVYLLLLQGNATQDTQPFKAPAPKASSPRIVQSAAKLSSDSVIVDRVKNAPLLSAQNNNVNNKLLPGNSGQQQPSPQSPDSGNSNIVDKLYDSNNKLVVQDGENNSPDSTYKKVEEDDKSPDEIDKIRNEMMLKSSNSIIIHDSEFDNNNNNNNNNNEKQPKKVVAELKSEAVNKDVITRILDHNSNVNGNNTKVIAPESANSGSVWWRSEIRDKYMVLHDYILATVQGDYDMRSITLSTQGTPDFFEHAPQLCDRWGEGFISLAVYAPGDDFRLAVNMIYYMRQCSLKCVKERITWHLIFEEIYSPKIKPIGAPETYLETPLFDCNIPIEETMKQLKIDSNFRAEHKLPYPINVLRNVARLGSKTKYLLASDIELYPSVGIVPAFFDLLDAEKRGEIKLINPKKPHVYHLPIFEVKAEVSAPRTKKELIARFAKKEAIFFHKFVCDLCQNYPDRNIWIKEVPVNASALHVFRSTKRLHARNQWEPLYIGTNAEPFYDERLTWDGKRDKMSQMFEMCLLDYDILVLDNAFLVHAPGIKYYHVKDDEARMKYIVANQKVYTRNLSEMRRKYKTKNSC